MKISTLPLSGLSLIELDVYGDERGFFIERYNEARFAELGLPVRFIQDNHSRSLPTTLRGLHYQVSPPQGKLVGVIRGEILDVVVDIRPNSPTYGQHAVTTLSDRNGCLLWIPAGFAHGFCVTGTEPADVLYKVDGSYDRSSEGGILWSDPDLGIDWPHQKPIVSPRDRLLPRFADYRQNPVDW